ncbi:MAG: efflux RND transporter periplasmic adaptor subunit [Rhodospirillaceae bacterium]|nr:efflux RND transporter periplasmic adaptor subunit [Rhodospirillaceae bacterium]
MRRLLLLAAIVAAALGLGAGVWWYVAARPGGAPTYVTVPAERGDIERTVTALGTLKPLQYVDVGAQVSGQLEKIHVNPGDVVQKGQLLAEIDPTVFLARVDADRADLLNLQAQLAQTQAQLGLNEAQFRRQAELLKVRATSQDAYESSRAAVEIAKAQIAALRAQIQKVQSTLAADQANLGYTQIRAPMDGTIMSLSARQGQTLNANQSAPIILQIADLSTMTVWTQVSEADVGKLAVGMDAYFTTLGHPGRRWTGRLRQILPTPEVVNNVVLYDALFDVANPDRLLMPQMTAQVFFVLERASDAVIVPVAALRPAQGQTGAERTVWVKTASGAIERRRVRIGIQNRVSVQILSGLEPGDQVVVGEAGGAEARAPAGGRGLGLPFRR